MDNRIAAPALRLALAAALSCAACLAGTWSGDLVDARCFANEQSNVNPTDTDTFVDTDRSYEIRYCAPKAKTKDFAIVQTDGIPLRLDAKGNAKAAELVRKAGKKSLFRMEVTGQRWK